MSLDPLLPVAPARATALLLPLGQIKVERFASFVERLQEEHVVHLRDITADGRPNRTMFSPLAYPDGAMIYDFITHAPPPSHLALSPFDLYREPLGVIALADGTELEDRTFSKRRSANGTGPTIVEKNIRALYQELEDLRDNYPKALVHQVLLFDYVAPKDAEIPIPEGIVAIPPAEACKRTTMKTVMCDISSLLLAEMTTLAKSFEAMTAIESPGHYSPSKHTNGSSWSGEGMINGMSRRNSQFALPHHSGRSNSASGLVDRNPARMSMPMVPSRPTIHSSSSTPGRPSTPVKSGLSNPPISSESASASGISSPEQKDTVPDISERRARDRVSVQGFGPGGASERWRLKGKGRSHIVVGSMYLQAGRWSDSLKELGEGATAARSLNDHVWHGKALELILMNLILLGWRNLEFVIPMAALGPQERSSPLPSFKSDPEPAVPDQPKHLQNLQTILPDLLDRILALYSRISAENLPPLPLAETTIRFAKILSALHLCEGKLDQRAFTIMVTGKLPDKALTTSPRLGITPSRQHIVSLLFKAFPSSASELLTTADRASILSGISTVLGPLGFQRKKAMVIRELVSVLIGGLVEARTKGAAEMGIHPAAGLVSLASANGQQNGAMALDLGEGDIEQGIEAILSLLCRSYGIIEFDRSRSMSDDASSIDDSDEAAVARISSQSATRFFGFSDIKLNILRACINFSEALPDFNGALRFSSDLLRTAGSGVAPGPRREDASPMIHSEEQIRLTTNITRTSALVNRMGVTNIAAEYWDEFLVRAIKLEPLLSSKLPFPHSRSVLPGATATRSSQDVDPFIYNPFLKEADEAAVAQNLVAGELATFKITLQNPYDVEVDVERICLDAEGVAFEPVPESTVIGPYRTQVLRIKGKPLEPGAIKITGAVIKVRGCRERRFPIFVNPWTPSREPKIKAKGVAGLEECIATSRTTSKPLETDTLSLNVIQQQPQVVVKSTTLPQSSLMILEGERQTFSVTLKNLSSTPVDFLLFSFKDSTQPPLQAAINDREATPAELYEYELVLMKRQALRLPRNDQGRHIAPGGEATFEFEIFGKPGLTHASIQVDYTHLGCSQQDIPEQFFTRQVSVDLTVTVNASVELARIDALPIHGQIPKPLLERLGALAEAKPDDYCLLSVDLRNSWPSHIAIHIESDDGVSVDEDILPGSTCRVILPVKRVYLEDPHATIPTLNPSRKRQFVVSSSKISPEKERANREAFWYRERILDTLRATWRTTSVPKRNGSIELRNLRLSTRMIEAIKVDEVGIRIAVEDASGKTEDAERNVAYVDEFMQLKLHVKNRTAKPIYPLVRLMPALCHRPLNVALDYTRKIAWNGTLQQHLPKLEGHGSAEVTIGMTALCRGEFEITASVEEVQVWEDPNADKLRARPRSETQTMMDAALGVKERRIWHARQPYMLTVKDRE